GQPIDVDGSHGSARGAVPAYGIENGVRLREFLQRRRIQHVTDNRLPRNSARRVAGARGGQHAAPLPEPESGNSFTQVAATDDQFIQWDSFPAGKSNVKWWFVIASGRRFRYGQWKTWRQESYLIRGLTCLPDGLPPTGIRGGRHRPGQEYPP